MLRGEIRKDRMSFFTDLDDLFPDKVHIFHSDTGAYAVLRNLYIDNYFTGIPIQLFSEMNDTGLSIHFRNVDYPEFRPRQKYFVWNQVMDSVELPVEKDRYEQISRELYGRVLKLR